MDKIRYIVSDPIRQTGHRVRSNIVTISRHAGREKIWCTMRENNARSAASMEKRLGDIKHIK